jgi:hypothetical protein
VDTEKPMERLINFPSNRARIHNPNVFLKRRSKAEFFDQFEAVFSVDELKDCDTLVMASKKCFEDNGDNPSACWKEDRAVTMCRASKTCKDDWKQFLQCNDGKPQVWGEPVRQACWPEWTNLFYCAGASEDWLKFKNLKRDDYE